MARQRRIGGSSCVRGKLAALLVPTLLLAVMAAAQLTDADLNALRARGRAEGWTFQVGPTSATARPVETWCGFRLPADWREGARFVRPAEKFSPPSRFDWREHNGCTPVRDQEGCGSCWAFATLGPLECNIRIKDGLQVDLSEQWLLDCNTDEYNCEGGSFVYDYLLDKPDACGGVGAVPESACPYTAEQGPCLCTYPHTYRIHAWAYLWDGGDGVPDINDIKWAIMTYGPVAVCVCTDLGFGAYSGGIYNEEVGGEPNHAVVLVGWDDAQGENGVWFLRNSWGHGWGEYGYMRIAYGCSSIGIAASFVDYPGQNPGVGPVLTEQPANGRVHQGFSHVFFVAATTTHGALRYQWLHEGEPVTDELPDALFVIPAATPADEGAYRCIVKDMQGATLSDEVYLEVIPGQVPALGPAGLAMLCFVFVVVSRARCNMGDSHKHG